MARTRQTASKSTGGKPRTVKFKYFYEGENRYDG